MSKNIDTDHLLKPFIPTISPCKAVSSIHDEWPYRRNQQSGAKTPTRLTAVDTEYARTF